MNILLTGGNGFLGQHMYLYLKSIYKQTLVSGRGECKIKNIDAADYYSFDLTDELKVATVLTAIKPDVVIHMACMSKPDECEEQKDAAILQNTTVTEILLKHLKEQQPAAKFIYFSTDFIFGENGPHAEDELPAPLNFYGQTKMNSEQLVKASGLDYAIVRPVFIYGEQLPGQRPSFLHWVKNNLEAGKKIKVVTDQKRTPTYALDICKGVHAIIEKNVKGDFHLAGKDIISPYEMAITVAEVLQLDKNLIEPVTADTFPEKVKRAQRSGLKIDKAISVLNYQPVSFAEGVLKSFRTS